MVRSKTPPARKPLHRRLTPGRAAPRSRLGCTTCKRRHVRCNEAFPSYEPCYRLQLQCYYSHRSQQAPGPVKQRTLLPSPTTSGASVINSSQTCDIAFSLQNKDGYFISPRDENDWAAELDSISWCNSTMAIDVDSVCLSWAGQLEAYDNPTSLFSNSSRPRSDSDVIAGARVPILSEHPDPRSFHDAANLWRPENSSTRSTQTGESFHLDSLLFTSARLDHQHPFKVFGKIMQPPTGILIASIKKWQLL